jgi:preprotein translocase subunit YajC
MPRRGTAGANLVRLPMEQLLVIAATFFVLWLLFIRPQQRRVRAHQALVATLEPGDEVILTAGIYGRIVELGPEDMTLIVAPGVELKVARQAVLRKVEDATEPAEPGEPEDAPAEPDEAGPSAPEPNV